MLRYKADRRTLAFVATYYVLTLWLWFAAPRAWYLLAPTLVVLCALSWICAVITHNTVHSPVFKYRLLNKWFQIVLTCAYGFPVSGYVPGHNLSHHRHMQGRADVMRTTKGRFSWNLLNLLFFFAMVGVDVEKANQRFARTMKKQHPRWFQQFVTEALFCWGIKAVLLLVDWRKCLLFIVLPHAFALWGITTVNFLQHDGADHKHQYNHSRNFVGALFNWFTFNNGFHTVHHDVPGLHWSLTPARHWRDVHPHIHPALEQPSLALYVFRTFLFPGERVNYDGSPYVLPEEGPDEDWVPKPDSDALEGNLGAEG